MSSKRFPVLPLFYSIFSPNQALFVGIFGKNFGDSLTGCYG